MKKNLAVLICLFLSISVCNSASFRNETFGNIEIVIGIEKGKPNYTLQILDKQTGVVLCNLSNIIEASFVSSGKKVLIRDGAQNDGETRFRVYDTEAGSLVVLGRYAQVFRDVLLNSVYCLDSGFVDGSNGELIVLDLASYSTVKTIDLSSVIRAKYKSLNNEDRFFVQHIFGSEKRTLWLLFDHWGELGPKTFAIAINVDDLSLTIPETTKSIISMFSRRKSQ
jgi:hypothetical protein